MPTTVALGKNCVSCFLWPLGIVEACRVSRILSHALCCLEGRVGSTTVRIPSVEVNNQLRLLQRFDTFTANVCVWFALSSLVHRHCCQRSKANWQVCCIAKYCSSVFFQLIDDTDFHAKFIWDRFLLFPKKSQINQRLFFFLLLSNWDTESLLLSRVVSFIFYQDWKVQRFSKAALLWCLCFAKHDYHECTTAICRGPKWMRGKVEPKNKCWWHFWAPPYTQMKGAPADGSDLRRFRVYEESFQETTEHKLLIR